MIRIARITTTMAAAAMALYSAYYFVWRVMAQQNGGPE